MPMLMTLRMRLPVWPFHAPLRTRLAEVGHLVEHGVDLGHDVLAVHDDGRASRRAQGHVQDGPVLRDVDLLAAEHGVDPRAQAGFLGQLQEQLERFVGDAILRVVEVEARGLGRQALAALGIVREEVAEMQVADLLMMGSAGPSTPGVRSGARYRPSSCLSPGISVSSHRRNPPRNALALSPSAASGRQLLQLLGRCRRRARRRRARGRRSAGPRRPRRAVAISSFRASPVRAARRSPRRCAFL